MKENRRADFAPQNGPYEVQKFIYMIGFPFCLCFRVFPEISSSIFLSAAFVLIQ